MFAAAREGARFEYAEPTPTSESYKLNPKSKQRRDTPVSGIDAYQYEVIYVDCAPPEVAGTPELGMPSLAHPEVLGASPIS